MHINIVNGSLTKDQNQYNWTKIIFLTNGARKIGHSYTRKNSKPTHRPYTKSQT